MRRAFVFSGSALFALIAADAVVHLLTEDPTGAMFSIGIAATVVWLIPPAAKRGART